MGRRLIDLSIEIYDGMPVFPGQQQTKVWDFNTFENTAAAGAPVPYATKALLISDHGPTHVDAPNHLDPSPEAPGVDVLPLEYFFNGAICLDLSWIPPLTAITAEQVKEALNESGFSIERGETVLIYTGHHRRTYGTAEWLNSYPGLSSEATAWILDKGAVGIGIDTPGIDPAKTTAAEAHKVCRNRRRVVTENLTNLDQVVGKRFTWVALPLKIRGSSGSPVRAIAVLEEG